MRYLGSKTSTLDDLEHLVTSRITHGTFCDPFGGIGTVGSAFKRRGFEVHTGDLLEVAHCFQTARIVLGRRPRPPIGLVRELGIFTADEMILALKHSPPVKSWVFREFSQRRQFFTPDNAAAIDGVRRSLNRWKRDGLTNELTDLYLRACLIDAADRVANTAGTYYAHLKHWTRKALKPFDLRSIWPVPGQPGCTASLLDAAELVASGPFDVLYLDPPYNSRDYAGYYHLPETLATGRRPRPRGDSGADAAPRPRSAFTRPRSAEGAMEELIAIAQCQLLVVHYSDDGLIPHARLRSLLRSFGTVTEKSVSALGYGTRRARQVHHRLYLAEP